MAPGRVVFGEQGAAWAMGDPWLTPDCLSGVSKQPWRAWKIHLVAEAAPVQQQEPLEPEQTVTQEGKELRGLQGDGRQ